MRSFVLAASLMLAAPSSADETSTKAARPATDTYSQRDLLKNWALSACLAMVATDEQTKADANATAGAYMEYGRQGIEAYEELRKLAETYAMRHYAGSDSGEFNTMKCIDLFHSADLNRLVIRLAKEK